MPWTASSRSRRGGPAAGQVAERGVAEDHERRQAALGRPFARRSAAQRLEQAAIDAFPRGRADLGFLLLRLGRLEQPRGDFAAEQAAALGRDGEHVVLAGLLQEALADELLDPVADAPSCRGRSSRPQVLSWSWPFSRIRWSREPASTWAV